MTVVEKEAELATHQTGHNSGVLHAGLYYAPGSLKARLCREGKADVEAFAEAHDIPFDHCGKLVVALDDGELPRLAALRERALANGVPGLEDVGRERILEIEPHAAGIQGLWSPGTGIIDFRRVALAMADEIAARGAEIVTSWPASDIDTRGPEVVVRGPEGEERVASLVVACAGLHADRLARMTGDDDDPRIVPFRGDYYTLDRVCGRARSRADLSRPGPALPVPRRPLHEAHRRGGVGRSECRARVRPGRLSPA